MRLPAVPSGRVPDVMFISNEKLDRISRTHLVGAADFVIEIVSLESDTRDRKRKRAEYEASGVSEYWIVDPLQKTVAFLLAEDGKFRDSSPDSEGVYRSAVIEGLFISVNWLWQEPRPTIVDMLKEWGLI